MSTDIPLTTNIAGSADQATLALCGAVAGVLLIAKKQKALAGIGLAVLSIGMLALAYTYIIPQYIQPLLHPQLLRGLSALLLAIVGVVAVYRLANGAVYLLLVALTAPLTYQFLSLMWQLQPPEKWDQVKLFVSLISAVFISTFLIQHLEATSQLAAVVLGSLLIAAAVQYLYEDKSYLGGVSLCLGSPKEGWDASECTPFYMTWLGLILVTGAWSLVSALSGSRAPTYVVTQQPAQAQPFLGPRSDAPSAGYRPLGGLERPPPQRDSVWESVKSGGRKVKDFFQDKFTDKDIQDVRVDRVEAQRHERVP